MIVKIMSGEDCPDDDPRKSFILIDGVRRYHAERNTSDGLELTVETRDEDEPYHFVPEGNVYVMNDAGKTIAHVGVSPPHQDVLPEYDPGDPLPPRAKVKIDEIEARNHFGVTKSVWRKWTLNGRHTFNAVYAEMGDVSQSLICHPDTLKKGMPDEEWETIRWNVAWLAAHRLSGFEKQKLKNKEDGLFVGYND